LVYASSNNEIAGKRMAGVVIEISMFGIQILLPLVSEENKSGALDKISEEK
jgi:hypothetical protein